MRRKWGAGETGRSCARLTAREYQGWRGLYKFPGLTVFSLYKEGHQGLGRGCISLRSQSERGVSLCWCWERVPCLSVSAGGKGLTWRLGWASAFPAPAAASAGVVLSDTGPLGLPPAPWHSSVSGLNNGDLLLKDISREDDGLYQCTVANHVGYSVCVVEVKVSGRCSGRGPGGPGTRGRG